MAVNALTAQLGRIARPGMARRTDQTLMLAGQGKTGLLIMIEPPDLPIGRIVAVLAWRWCSQCSGMAGVSMASRTIGAFGSEGLVCVTG